MMSVYEISLILLDVFPGLSDLTLLERTFGMCKCAVNFLPFCTNYPEIISTGPHVQGKKLQWCQKAALKSLMIRRIYFSCWVIQLCLKLVLLCILVCLKLVLLFILVCKHKNRKHFEIWVCIQTVIWINWRTVLTVGSGGCSTST